MRNGIIFETAMAEKKLENGEVSYSAACPTGRERFEIICDFDACVIVVIGCGGGILCVDYVG